MNEKACDFWGISYNLSGRLLHVQSYFLVFKKQVFLSEVFKNFINGITKQTSKDEIVKSYEIGLSSLLIDNKFIPETYLSNKGDIAGEFLFCEKMSPFIKVSSALKTYNFVYKIILNFLFKKYKLNYPKNLILDYLKTRKTPKQLKYNIRVIRGVFFKFHLKERRIYLLGR